MRKEDLFLRTLYLIPSGKHTAPWPLLLLVVRESVISARMGMGVGEGLSLIC